MKKLLLGLLAVSSFSVLADDATKLTFQGKTNEGESCSITLSSAGLRSDNVVALATLSGNGIPFNLGGMTTKLKRFEMVYYSNSKDTLASLQSEFDPAVHIKLKSTGEKVSIESYELFLGGLRSKIINCE